MVDDIETPDIEGLKAAIDVTKLLITLAGAGLAFVMSVSSNLPTGWASTAFYIGVISLAVSTAAGLLVLMQAASNMSNRNYDLSDAMIKVPGMVNFVSFFIGVLAVGFIAFSKLQAVPVAKSDCLQFNEFKLCEIKK